MALETGTEQVTQKLMENMKISRGEKPDPETDAVMLDKAKHATVFDEFGNKIIFNDLYKSQKTIIILIRHFLCFMAKEYVDDLALIPEGHLKDANVKLVVIGCAPCKFIKEFKYLTGYKHELYCDPDRHVYKALGCHDRPKTGPVRKSHHVKSGLFAGVFKSMWRGMKHREYQGDINQQGGAFILGPGDVIEYQHRDFIPYDLAPINELLRVAGVEQVTFEKDAPVITI